MATCFDFGLFGFVKVASKHCPFIHNLLNCYFIWQLLYNFHLMFPLVWFLDLSRLLLLQLRNAFWDNKLVNRFLLSLSIKIEMRCKSMVLYILLSLNGGFTRIYFFFIFQSEGNKSRAVSLHCFHKDKKRQPEWQRACVITFCACVQVL